MCHRGTFKFLISCTNKVKPLYRPRWPMGLALSSSFLSMKWPGVLLFPPGWDASLSQGYPQHICWYPFVHLGEEKHCKNKMSCLRTQWPQPGLEPLNLESSTLTMRPVPPQGNEYDDHFFTSRTAVIHVCEFKSLLK